MYYIADSSNVPESINYNQALLKPAGHHSFQVRLYEIFHVVSDLTKIAIIIVIP